MSSGNGRENVSTEKIKEEIVSLRERDQIALLAKLPARLFQHFLESVQENDELRLSEYLPAELQWSDKDFEAEQDYIKRRGRVLRRMYTTEY